MFWNNPSVAVIFAFAVGMMDVSVEALTDVMKDTVCLQKLARLSALRQQTESHQVFQLSTFDDDSRIRKSFDVKVGPELYGFLVWKETGEEVVLEVQGLLLSCALPPITRRTRFPTYKAHILKQTVTLCGPGDSTFQKSMSALGRIHQFMDERFAQGEVRRYESTSASGMDTIVAGTRILTPVENATWALKTEALTSAIDPDNILRNVISTGKYRFTEDNAISFWEMVTDDVEGMMKPISASPSVFRQGQLVEMGINIRAVRTGSTRTVIHRIECLTMHDRYGVKLLADKTSHEAKSSRDVLTSAPRKRKLAMDSIMFDRGVRSRLEDMSMNENDEN